MTSGDGMGHLLVASTVVATLLSVGGVYATDTSVLHAMNGHQEDALIRSLEAMQLGQVDEALTIVEQILESDPAFHLAQLIKGDILLSKARGLKQFGEGADQASSRLRELVAEARVRVNHRRQHPSANSLPGSLIQVSRGYRKVLVADLSESRLYIFENQNGRMSLADDFYVTSGRGGAFKQVEGDLKTPIGVYFVTGRIPSERLPELYGAGALPLDYPNEWDRRLGRTGYGIWLHGVPSSTYSRAPRATEGCLALPNEDFRALWDLGETDGLRTPIIIVDRAKWIDRSEVYARRAMIESAVERWRKDWESQDHERYGRNYSEEFRAGSFVHETWLARKRRVISTKRFIRIELREMSVFAYPGEANLRVVSFEQAYESDRINSRTRKKQYWKREGDGIWRIIYEGDV